MKTDDLTNEAISAFRSGYLLWKGADSVKVSFGWDSPDCDYVIFDTERASYYWCLAERIVRFCKEHKSLLSVIYPDECEQAISLIEAGDLILHRYTDKQRQYHDGPLQPWH